MPDNLTEAEASKVIDDLLQRAGRRRA